MFKNTLRCARRFLTNVTKLPSKSINIKRGLRYVQLFLLWCVTTFSQYTVFLFAQNVNRIYRLAWTHFIVFARKRILHIHMRSIYSHIIYDKRFIQASHWIISFLSYALSCCMFHPFDRLVWTNIIVLCVCLNAAHEHTQYLFAHSMRQNVHASNYLNVYIYIFIIYYLPVCKCRGRVNRQECQERDFIVSVIKLASSRKTYPRSIDTSSFWSLWRHQIEIFPRYRPFVRGIHRSPVNSPQKGQWRGALMFSLICAWINFWVNNREAGDLWRHHAHNGVIVMLCMWSAFGIGI